MLVRDRMTKPVVTVTPKTPIEEAMKLMQGRRIRRLPVVRNDEIVGIVTWTDLMHAQPSSATTLSRWEIPALLKKAQVHEVMGRNLVTIGPDVPLEEAATIMRQRKIGGLPVIKNGVLVGMVTESDIFDAFIAMLGAREPSFRVTMDVDDSAATLPDITAAFRLLGLRLFSVSTYPGKPGRLSVVARVERAIPLTRLVTALEERGLNPVHATDGNKVVFETVPRSTG
jgi:acetoin utilization protein AcuB